MRLFLAKQDGNWMNGEGVVAVKLEKAAGGAVPVLVDGHGNRYDFVKMDPTRWIKNSKYFGANFQPGKGQIHVLVVIDWENFSGKDWPYQGASELVAVLTDPLLDHYKAWEAGNEDKQNHAINLVLSGPGTGKSRMLDEMKDLLCKAAERSKNQNLVKRMASAYTFHVTFEDGTGSNGSLLLSDEVPEYDVSYRMLYQLTKEIGDWTVFHNELKRSYGHLLLTIATVVDMLAELTMTDVENLTVILFMNASQAFVVCVCSATVHLPIMNALADSPQRHVLLVPSVLKGDQIWKPKTGLEKQLMDDMGGHGRALEVLDAVLQKYAREELEEFEPTGIVKKVWIEMKNRCGDLLDDEFYNSSSNVQDLLAAILSRRRYDPSSRFGTGNTSRTIDELRSFGLFRLTGEGHLECAFILFYHLMMEISERLPGVDDNLLGYFTNFVLSWQRFENFVAFHRRLKSIAYSGIEVEWSAFHDGSRFGPIDNIYIEEPNPRHLVVEAVSQHATKSSASDFKVLADHRGELDISETKTIIINGTSASTADVFSQVQLIIDKRQVQCNEVIQCKLVQAKQKLTESTYLEEMLRTVDEDLDVFLLITPAEATEFPLPPHAGSFQKTSLTTTLDRLRVVRIEACLIDRMSISRRIMHCVELMGSATRQPRGLSRRERNVGFQALKTQSSDFFLMGTRGARIACGLCNTTTWGQIRSAQTVL
ncbi:hypothetical protein PF003_g34293 [Phytophthora fragariae]|nr:hypothetical protein PF003_g34293 [Phytophthora fragariae]